MSWGKKGRKESEASLVVITTSKGRFRGLVPVSPAVARTIVAKARRTKGAQLVIQSADGGGRFVIEGADITDAIIAAYDGPRR